MNVFQLTPDLITCQITAFRKKGAHPAFKRPQLAPIPMVALTPWFNRAGFLSKFDHIVDEFRRNTEMPGRFTMTVPLVYKGDNPAPQLYRMWLPHQ